MESTFFSCGCQGQPDIFVGLLCWNALMISIYTFLSNDYSFLKYSKIISIKVTWLPCGLGQQELFGELILNACYQWKVFNTQIILQDHKYKICPVTRDNLKNCWVLYYAWCVIDGRSTVVTLFCLIIQGSSGEKNKMIDCPLPFRVIIFWGRQGRGLYWSKFCQIN